MKLSIFSTITNPEKRQDPYQEAIDCYKDLADEVVIMDGSGAREAPIFYDNVKVYYHKWPEKFEWKFIGEQFQRAYDKCTGDWIIRCDIDYLFHEKDFADIRKVLEQHKDSPAITFWKYQFTLADRYNLKSRIPIAFNKRFNIKLNGGGDFCQPTIKGKALNPDELPEAGIPVYNYDFTFKDKETIKRDFWRFAKGWYKQFGKDTFGSKSPSDALRGFKTMMVGRYTNREFKRCSLEEHPKYIREKIKNLTPEQFGYNMFGWAKEKAYED